MGFIAITREDIDVAQLLKNAKNPQTGGIVIFVGTVRDDGIEAMEFESFDEVAIKDLETIAEQATEQFSLNSVDIIHRNGLLKVEDTILVIVVGAVHRPEAFEGCRFILEEIKRYIPIWKKDIHTRGEEHWHH